MSGLRERAARASYEHDYPDPEPWWSWDAVAHSPAPHDRARADGHRALAAAVLASLDHPETVAEVAGVLAEHMPDLTTYDAYCLDGCRSRECQTWYPTSDDAWADFARHQAQAVIAHLAGRP